MYDNDGSTSDHADLQIISAQSRLFKRLLLLLEVHIGYLLEKKTHTHNNKQSGLHISVKHFSTNGHN